MDIDEIIDGAGAGDGDGHYNPFTSPADEQPVANASSGQGGADSDTLAAGLGESKEDGNSDDKGKDGKGKGKRDDETKPQNMPGPDSLFVFENEIASGALTTIGQAKLAIKIATADSASDAIKIAGQAVAKMDGGGRPGQLIEAITSGSGGAEIGGRAGQVAGEALGAATEIPGASAVGAEIGATIGKMIGGAIDSKVSEIASGIHGGGKIPITGGSGGRNHGGGGLGGIVGGGGAEDSETNRLWMQILSVLQSIKSKGLKIRQ